MAINVQVVEQYIRQAARQRGMDPDKVVQAARTEGLGPGIWQSNASKGGIREPSFGPFQLLVGGPGTGYPTGLGNAFMDETGLDPRDPSNVNATIDYALDTVAKEGWQQWYGPKNAGLDRWYGVQGAKPAGVTPPLQLDEDQKAFVRNNPQPGGFGAAVEQAVFGTMAPQSPSVSPTSPMMAGPPGVPKDVADYATAEDGGRGKIYKALAEMLEPPAPPRISGSLQGPSGQQASALLNVLNSPNMGDILFKKRISGAV